MSVTVNGSTGLTFNDGTSQSTSAFYGGLALRNRIINGAMMIDQRNAGASVTSSASNAIFPVDRLQMYVETGSSGVFTGQQSSTAPTGFTNSVICTVTTADSSIGASEGYTLQQRIEGFNTADLGFGTANAQTVTLSFWVRSSVTGTFSGSLTNGSFNRSYVFNYTISAANTWEQKTITVAGDTSGTWNTTNGTGLIVYWNIGAGSNFVKTANTWGTLGWASSGSTNLIATSGATFYITGVQLEKGSTATSFDYRPYGTELALCQRYYEKSININAVPANDFLIGVNGTSAGAGLYAYTSSGARTALTTFQVSKRAAPTISFFRSNLTATNGAYGYYRSGVWTSSTSTIVVDGAQNMHDFAIQVEGTYTSGETMLLAGIWTASAEL